MIVPNAELISSKVINWTLSKYTRRLTMTIHTHKETATDKVLKLMKEAVSRVEFALYYWASGNILDCKSLVNQEVQKALVKENIEFVMPLHVYFPTERSSSPKLPNTGG